MAWLPGCAKTDPPNQAAVESAIESGDSPSEGAQTERANTDVNKAVTNGQATPKKLPPKEDEIEPRLQKTNTLLVLAFQTDIRASNMLLTMRPYMNDEQVKEGKRLALTYDWRFEEIKKKRAAILEGATDDQDIDAMLHATRVETADLIGEIRARIMTDILTHEQRLKVQARYKKDQPEK